MANESRLFPIIFNPRGRQFHDVLNNGDCVIVVAVPWAMIAQHEAQALKNHSQSLEQLAARGGLATFKALAVIEGRSLPQRPVDHAAHNRKLLDMVYEQKIATSAKRVGGPAIGKERADG